MIILFFHLSFLLKNYKKRESKSNMQNFFDYCIRQIELSVREIGYGDATINKKMKEYVNLLFSIIDKLHNWDNKNSDEKKEIINLFIVDAENYDIYLDYFDKYNNFLTKNSFKNLTKDILTH